MFTAKYKRVLLKLSGRALMGKTSYGIDSLTLEMIAQQIKQVKEAGVEVAIVVGGGNIWRGTDAEARGMERELSRRGGGRRRGGIPSIAREESQGARAEKGLGLR